MTVLSSPLFYPVFCGIRLSFNSMPVYWVCVAIEDFIYWTTVFISCSVWSWSHQNHTWERTTPEKGVQLCTWGDPAKSSAHRSCHKKTKTKPNSKPETTDLLQTLKIKMTGLQHCHLILCYLSNSNRPYLLVHELLCSSGNISIMQVIKIRRRC